MRIVQLVTGAPGDSGLHPVVEHLGAGYVQAGHHRVVVTPGRLDRCTVAPDGTWRITVRGPARMPGRPTVTPRADRLQQLLTSLRPDALEVSGRSALRRLPTWARRQGIATTVIVHDRRGHGLGTTVPGGPVIDGWPADRIERSAERAPASAVGSVVVPSRFAARTFPAGRAMVVPWGVDLRQFHPTGTASSRPGFGRPNEERRPVRLVATGRLAREHRPDLAIAVVQELLARGREVRLDVVGDGPLLGSLRCQARGLPVVFHGERPTVDVARVLRSADVAVATSPVDTSGLAALEALASGVPVVAPTTGVVPELLAVPGGAPVVTPAGALASPTAAAMEFAIHRLLDHPEHDRREAARARAEPRTWTAAVDILLARHDGRPRLHLAA